MNKTSIFYRFARDLYHITLDMKMILLRVINFFIVKDKHHLLFIPSENCRNDKYDIENNGADNVLKLCDGIIHDERFYNYHISIAVYHPEKITYYRDYCINNHFKGVVNFFFYDDRKSFFKAVCKSSMIFSTNFYRPIRYKVKRQQIMCLGYFVVPFKDDYFKIEHEGYRAALKKEKMLNRIFNYHLSTSNFCSRELSVDSLFYKPKYQVLGFPRNDIFFEDFSKYRKKIEAALGFCPKIIMAFVPTHRNYERKTHYLYDASLAHPHSLFGDITDADESKINEFLEKEDVVIIAKAHPMQDKDNISATNSNRIVYFSDLIEKCQINLQEIMAASDIFATDYSTACFDFLLTDRPAIYYFYDYEKQCKSRSFFVDPITPFCAGDIVYDLDGFLAAVKKNIENPERHKEQRHWVRDMLFYHKDGNSSERLLDFIYKLTN